MYIPKINLAPDEAEVIQFMQRFSFATIITAKNNYPIATHLPFLVQKKEDKIILQSHFALANLQWKEIENDEVLVIFSEPHAYISASNYDTKENVPTWNYISVHAYGKGKVMNDLTRTFDILEATINYFDKSYQAQWESLPLAYKTKMANGIVAFEVVVTDLQAKKKLSQNRSEAEKEKIISQLSQSDDSNENRIAEYMKQL